MAGDELNDPLGAPATRLRRSVPYRTFGLAGLAVLGLAFGTFLFTTGDPHGGEPSAVAPIPPAPPAPPPQAVAADPTPTGKIAAADRSSAAEVETESGVRVVRPGGSAAPDALIIEVPRVNVQLAPAPDPRLIERTHLGLLPRIGPDGARPRDVYARPVDLPAKLPRNAPRIAIVIGGVGLNEAATASAIADLPPAVTLGIAPYGPNLQTTVAQARAAGHEVLLQVPMAPFDGTVPGPHMLTADGTPQETLADLHWLMSRFTGYVGIGNFLGAKFTADPAALTPVIQDLADRGLLYFDDGSSARSAAAGLAAQRALPFARADVILDAPGRGDTINAAFLQLEGRARDVGIAIGMANDLPSTVERIARFARGLEARGIALVPLSATATMTPDVAARSR